MKEMKLISTELLKGAKMLSKHCEKCGYPLLEKDGRVYCIVCEKLGKDEKEVKEEKVKINSFDNINTKIYKKILYLVDKLDKEDDVSRIKEIGEALYILLKINKKLR